MSWRRALLIVLMQVQRLREIDLNNPAVMAKIRQRYDADIPYQEPAISPAAIFDSNLLLTASQH